jgi:hypothetical protein
MVEKLPCDPAVALDRCACEPLLILKMLREVSDQILSRRGHDKGGGTHPSSAQELEQLRNRLPLDLSSRDPNASAPMPAAVLIPFDPRFRKIGQHHPALCKPAV